MWSLRCRLWEVGRGVWGVGCGVGVGSHLPRVFETVFQQRLDCGVGHCIAAHNLFLEEEPGSEVGGWWRQTLGMSGLILICYVRTTRGITLSTEASVERGCTSGVGARLGLQGVCLESVMR